MTEISLPAEFRVRELLPSDLPAFIELGLPTCRAMYGRDSIKTADFRKNFEQFVRELAFESASKIYVVETSAHVLAGQIWLHQIQNRFNNAGELWIWDLTVHESYRRRGIGRALMGLALSRTQELGLQELWLLVSSENTNAIRLYQSMQLTTAGLLLSTGNRSAAKRFVSEITLERAQIRPLEAGDLPGLCRLWEQAGLPYRPEGRDHPDRLGCHLSGPQPGGWGILHKDELIAGALIAFDGRKGWIERVATLPGHRRTGLARALIAACTQSLKAAGALVIGALIEADNTGSRRLFEACGYVDSPTIRYYSIRDDPGC